MKYLSFDHSVRAKIGITLIALSALVSSSLLMFNRDIDTEHYVDYPSLHENRFKEFRNFLQPHTQTFVGYITDLQPDEETKKGYGVYLTQYYLAQYVLSPAIIAIGTDYPLVIGNFHKPVDISRISQDNHLTLIKDSDDGVMLFRGEKAR